jgi:hypothetical protein
MQRKRELPASNEGVTLLQGLVRDDVMSGLLDTDSDCLP